MKPDSLKDFILDQLGELRGLECRVMFGGVEKFCGILFNGRLYFKTDEATHAVFFGVRYETFQPKATQKLSSYCEVPADVIEDKVKLDAWASDDMKAAAK